MASRRALSAAKKAGLSFNAAVGIRAAAASQNGSVLHHSASQARPCSLEKSQTEAQTPHHSHSSTAIGNCPHEFNSANSRNSSRDARRFAYPRSFGHHGANTHYYYLKTQIPGRRNYSAAASLPTHEQIAMPSLSPTMTHGNIASWSKAVGDQISAGDVLCEIETDKATLAMESMEDGYLAKILLPEGTKDIPVGTPIAIMVDDASSVAKFADYTPGDTPAAPPASPAEAAAVAAPIPSDLPKFEAVGMPSLSPTMTQGNIAKWRKSIGDAVASGDVLCEIETDKATLEMESMEEGYVAKILFGDGSKDIPVGTPIAIMVEDAADIPKFANYNPSAAPSSSPPGASAPPPPPPAAAPASASAAAPAPAPAPPSEPTSPPGGRTLASPAAKKLAQDQGVDISLVAGTGPDGRVIKADVEDYLKAARPTASTSTASSSTTASTPPSPSPLSVSTPKSTPAVPPSELRKHVAARMVESVQSIPHYYLSVDTRLDNIQEMLSRLNAAQGKTNGVPITVEHFIVKAAAMASKKVPACNSSWEGDFINQYDSVNITLSVYTDYGLVNPVIKSVDTKGLAAIAEEMEALKKAAASGEISAEDTQGGTFSVVSVAEYGLKSCSSIINPPQACILTLGAGQVRVVPGSKPNEFLKETLSNATLSCDHRVVDGAVGAEWLGVFKSYVEDPLALLL